MQRISWTYDEKIPEKARIKNFENILEVKFPEKLIEIFENHNGGISKENCFKVLGKERILGGILPFDEHDIEDIMYTYKRIGKDFIPGIVPFAWEVSGDYICLDYTNSSKENPKISYWYHEKAMNRDELKNIEYEQELISIQMRAIYPIANSFEEFIDSLYDAEKLKEEKKKYLNIEPDVRRRMENNDYLKTLNINCPEFLPLTYSDKKINIRNSNEIAERAIALLMISIYSLVLLDEDSTVKKAHECVKNLAKIFHMENFLEIFSPKELEYFLTGGSEEDRINYIWSFESLWCIEWVLGVASWTYPSQICDVNFVNNALDRFISINDIQKNAHIRNKKEILDKADQIYLMDWAITEALINKEAMPADLHVNVVKERHKMFNWLCCYNNSEWDDVDIPT